MHKYLLPFAATVIIALGTTAKSGGRPIEPQSARIDPSVERSNRRVEFNRDIRPILSNNCFKCHGLDEKSRKAGLRLDDRSVATQVLPSGRTAIVSGQPGQSELIRRVFASDPDSMMPPAGSQRKLTDRDKALLRDWIEQGAEYQAHWSFIPARRAPLPDISHRDWPRNPIDYFILARLDAEHMQPSPETERTALIRRVTLDLTGLPPTPGEVDAFLGDPGDGAYERLVDRLLNSPRFGERMAVDWLDAARFADTHGYHIDSGRDMSRWREWVIDAFNHDMPFDQFTVEQLAGDLLPNATIEQKIASGFNRNHMINYEGGAIPEEYQVAYIVDRVNTTGTVWLGLTIGCAQCHDHKYDPISQSEYYGLYAFFHNIPENGLDGRAGNAVPVLRLPTPLQQRKSDELAQSIFKFEHELTGSSAVLDREQLEWEGSASVRANAEWTPLAPTTVESSGGAELTVLDDKSIRAGGANPATDLYRIVAPAKLGRITAIRVEALPDEQLHANGPGRSENGNVVLTEIRLRESTAHGADRWNSVTFKAASADFSQKDFSVAHAIDGKSDTGWAIHPEVGKPHSAVFELQSPLSETDASSRVLAVELDFQSKFAQHQLGRFRISVTGAETPQVQPKLPENIVEILRTEPGKRTEQQQAELRNYYRTQLSPSAKRINEQLVKVRSQQAELDKQVATTMVMQEMDKPRETFLLVRGQYDKKGDRVTAGIPVSLGSLPTDLPSNRLGLARWLIDPSQPLTARVIVNRFWQLYFGTGLVKTAEDFGSQGELPSHPELLDWLASEFRDSGWDVKNLMRLIVTSATYRQSSAASAESVSRDPENRLLARAPRLRLPVETIRDQALMLAGLLDGEIGGQSVAPYQPPGIWEELASRQDGKNFTAQEYVQSHGSDLYRRTMYTFIKRTAPPPALTTFDAPDRETCTVRRARTNTPLQALVLMNDPTYVEASRRLAERIMTEPPVTAPVDDRIRWVFRLVLARVPRAGEHRLLRELFEAQLDSFKHTRDSAAKLLAVGESVRNPQLDAAELAAWTMVAHVLLNLDETITK